MKAMNTKTVETVEMNAPVERSCKTSEHLIQLAAEATLFHSQDGEG